MENGRSFPTTVKFKLNDIESQPSSITTFFKCEPSAIDASFKVN